MARDAGQQVDFPVGLPDDALRPFAFGDIADYRDNILPASDGQQVGIDQGISTISGW